MKPIPPQYWRQLSLSSLARRPPFNLAMDASLVTSLPLMYNAAKGKGKESSEKKNHTKNLKEECREENKHNTQMWFSFRVTCCWLRFSVFPIQTFSQCNWSMPPLYLPSRGTCASCMIFPVFSVWGTLFACVCVYLCAYLPVPNRRKSFDLLFWGSKSDLNCYQWDEFILSC